MYLLYSIYTLWILSIWRIILNFFRMSTLTSHSNIKDTLLSVNSIASYPIKNDWQFFLSNHKWWPRRKQNDVGLTSLAHVKCIRLSMTDGEQYGPISLWPRGFVSIDNDQSRVFLVLVINVKCVWELWEEIITFLMIFISEERLKVCREF